MVRTVVPGHLVLCYHGRLNEAVQDHQNSAYPSYTDGHSKQSSNIKRDFKKENENKNNQKFTSTFVSNCLWIPSCCLKMHHVRLLKEEDLCLRIKVSFAQQR